MNDPMRIHVRWILSSLGKLLAVLLALFWGAFFMEHLGEWFLNRGGPWPPPWVWLGQGLHALMIVGLILMLWREDIGTWATVIATIAFFGVICGTRSFPFIALLNGLPILCFGLARIVARRGISPVG